MPQGAFTCAADWQPDSSTLLLCPLGSCLATAWCLTRPDCRSIFPSAQTRRPGRISTEKAHSGPAYDLFSSATHVFTSAQMSLVLTNDVVAVRFVLGFEPSAATAALCKERNISVGDNNSKMRFPPRHWLAALARRRSVSLGCCSVCHF